MATLLENFIYNWQKPYIRDQDLYTLFLGEESKRYDAVKYALRKGQLKQLRKGLYLIELPRQPQHYDVFELAQVIYGPAYISLETALSFHGWIPEAVYTTTSVTTRRRKVFETPIGCYSYAHTPPKLFYFGVRRIEQKEAIFFIAEPWKALADFIYCYKKSWGSISELCADLRIEPESIQDSDFESLKKIAEIYGSKYVQSVLNKFLMELK